MNKSSLPNRFYPVPMETHRNQPHYRSYVRDPLLEAFYAEAKSCVQTHLRLASLGSLRAQSDLEVMIAPSPDVYAFTPNTPVGVFTDNFAVHAFSLVLDDGSSSSSSPGLFRAEAFYAYTDRPIESLDIPSEDYLFVSGPLVPIFHKHFGALLREHAQLPSSIPPILPL